jgi:hypothetical protein
MRVIRRVARLIREAVRRFLEDPQNSLEPWEEELRFMDRWAPGPPEGPGRSGAPVEVLRTSTGTRAWRREDLHDRRPD